MNLQKLMGIAVCIGMISTGVLRAGNPGHNGQQKRMKDAHREVETDAFVPVDRHSMATTPACRIERAGFLAVQVNVDDSNQNIVGDAANEPTIAIDPTNPNRMAIGWRQFNTIASNFRQAGYAYTTDGGLTWTFPGVIQPGIFRSDPVLDSDSSGRFYYNSLTSSSGEYTCQVFRSSDGGDSWDSGTFAQGGDKQWMTIDKSGGMGEGHIYSSWTSYYSYCFPEFFTRSTDDGEYYEPCAMIPEDPFWGTMDVGPGGELYVGGAAGLQPSGFVVARSTTARDSDDIVYWDTTSLVSLDGDLVAFAGVTSPNPGGLHGQTWIAVDRSTGPGRGNVYLCASVDRLSSADPLDVMFAASNDGGIHWNPPVRINDDASTTAWQWFGTMSVAPTGRIDVVWLDTRNDPGTVLSSLYYAYSEDQGETWSANYRLSDAFDPHLGWPQQNKMGDYFHMISDSLGAHLAWAATFGGEQNVYYGRITLPMVGIAGRQDGLPKGVVLKQNYPNPFNPVTGIDFSLTRPGRVVLKIFNAMGQEVRTLVDGYASAGTNHATWDGRDDRGVAVSSGIYIYRLEFGGVQLTRKMLLMK